MDKKDTSSVTKPQAAFVVLFYIIALISFISMLFDRKPFAESGFFRIVCMSLFAVVSIVLTIAVCVLYFLKISHMESIKTRYLLVSICSVIICVTVVFRGFPYMQDIKDGTQVVETDKYWYYMGNEYIEFSDPSGKKQAVSAGNLGEATVPLIYSQFFSGGQSGDSEQNKISLYIEYYPHSRTVVDIHMVK